MSVIADILDMMKMTRNIKSSTCSDDLKKSLFDLSLVSISICILQLCLGLTVKRRSKRFIRMTNNSNQLIKSISCDEQSCLSSCLLKTQRMFVRIVNRLSELFEKEVWGIILLLLVKDLPFSILRTYALIAPPKNCELWNQSIFFTLKNYVTIVIQLNRCYVLANRSDSSDSLSQSSQHENDNNINKNYGRNKNYEKNSFFIIQQDSTQPLSITSSSTITTATVSPPSSITTKENIRNSSILNFRLLKKSNRINNTISSKTNNNNSSLNSITEISDSSFINNNYYL
jgi:hypothetical protein